MPKAKLYAIACARFVLWLFFSVLYPVFFLIYVCGQIGEWFITEYERFKLETAQFNQAAHEQTKKNV